MYRLIKIVTLQIQYFTNPIRLDLKLKHVLCRLFRRDVGSNFGSSMWCCCIKCLVTSCICYTFQQQSLFTNLFDGQETNFGNGSQIT